MFVVLALLILFVVSSLIDMYSSIQLLHRQAGGGKNTHSIEHLSRVRRCLVGSPCVAKDRTFVCNPSSMLSYALVCTVALRLMFYMRENNGVSDGLYSRIS